MNADLALIAVLAGIANWAFRFLPTRFDLSAGGPDSWLSRVLAATGPAAICTLFVASVLPAVQHLPKDTAALGAGLMGVCVVFAISRSVAGATFSGAIAFGGAFWAFA